MRARIFLDFVSICNRAILSGDRYKAILRGDRFFWIQAILPVFCFSGYKLFFEATGFLNLFYYLKELFYQATCFFLYTLLGDEFS